MEIAGCWRISSRLEGIARFVDDPDTNTRAELTRSDDKLRRERVSRAPRGNCLLHQPGAEKYPGPWRQPQMAVFGPPLAPGWAQIPTSIGQLMACRRARLSLEILHGLSFLVGCQPRSIFSSMCDKNLEYMHGTTTQGRLKPTRSFTICCTALLWYAIISMMLPIRVSAGPRRNAGSNGGGPFGRCPCPRGADQLQHRSAETCL